MANRRKVQVHRLLMTVVVVSGLAACAISERSLFEADENGNPIGGDGDGDVTGGTSGDGDAAGGTPGDGTGGVPGDGDGTGGAMPGSGGATSTGGSVGTGGMSTIPEACLVDPYLVHDMETNESCFGGGMVTIRDDMETGSVIPDTSSGAAFVYTDLDDGDAQGPGRAARMTGMGPYTEYAPSLAAIFTWDAWVDLSSYLGIRFQVRVDDCDPCTLRAEVQTSSVRGNDEEFTPGSCDAATETCHDAHGGEIDIASSGQWYEVELYFDDLTQQGWGTPKPFYAEEVQSLAVRIHNPSPDQLGSFGLWIDDIELIP